MSRLLTLSAVITLLAMAQLAMHANVALAVTTQTGAHVFNGRSFLYVEGEDYSALNETGNLDDGFIEVNKETPLVSNQGLDILPASSNVSGTALFDQIGGSYSHADTATWEVQFATAGTYQFYPRISIYDADGNGNFLNEDSIWLPPAFNSNSSTDWVGFEGLHYDSQNIDIDIPIPGEALDPLGWFTAVGDHQDDGRYEMVDWLVKSKGVVNSNPSDPAIRNGNFVWYWKPVSNNISADGAWVGNFGFKTEYIVTPDQVGETLTFEIGAREQYGLIDGFLFIQDDDNDLLDMYSQEELDFVLTVKPPVNIADLNQDGSVDGLDLGILLGNFGSSSDAAGGELNDTDPVDGLDLGILLGAWNPASLQGATAVPEPTSAMLLMSACCLLGLRRRA